MPPELLAALISLGVLALGLFGGYLGGWFKRQTDKANAAADKATAAAVLDTKAAQIKSDLEAQNLKERATILGIVDAYAKRVTALNEEIAEVRRSCTSEVGVLREEVRVARVEITELKQETKSQKREIEAGREREEKLRKDVNHMPEEIARLKALIEAKGNGDGQGDSKTVLSEESKARVADAEGDAENSESPP